MAKSRNRDAQSHHEEEVYRSRLSAFETLMPYRVRDILLVSSLYDSFTFEEDGYVSELLLQEYQQRNLWYAPRIVRYPTGDEALRAIESGRRFDMVITTTRVGGMDPNQLAHEMHSRLGPNLPVILMGSDNRDTEMLIQARRKSRDNVELDRIFVWTGDARLLFAMVSLIEDARNADHDTREAGVEVVLFVEDSIRFASAYLPVLYGELLRQTQSVLAEGLNVMEKVRRMRARPKVIWCESFEQACETYERYRPNMLGIISDVRYPRDGEPDPGAGFALARYARAYQKDLPILLQSHDLSNITQAIDHDAAFAHKNSRSLDREVRRFVMDNFGFGAFVFRTPDGTEVGRALDLRDMVKQLPDIPGESLMYHAKQNHFSKWAKARTEFALARALRPRSVEEFSSADQLRTYLNERLVETIRESTRHAVADFDPRTFDRLNAFAKLGGGSIGGKARGLAFANSLISRLEPERRWPSVRLRVPPSVVVGTKYFDEFMAENRLFELIPRRLSDDELRERFRAAALPEELRDDLLEVLRMMEYPLAVRSSSLLEDSLDQPFAGVYETYMLANSSKDLNRRLEEVLTAIKLVYASAFTQRAREYVGAIAAAPEMERMAVLIQQLVGRQRHGSHRFYPSFSGIARSYNYYPFGEKMKAEDGVAYVALGLGKTVVEGGRALRFCPKYPRSLPQFSTIDDILDNSQKQFYALRIDQPHADIENPFALELLDIDVAEADGTLSPIASVYSSENHTISDGISRPGPRIVTFASMLKSRRNPFPDILEALLSYGERGMSAPVEIEFAVNLPERLDEPVEVACLQMRPLVVMHESMDVDGAIRGNEQHIVCTSPRALGNGRIDGIRDIVFVDPDQFDRAQSPASAAAVGEMNAKLQAEQRPYVLIGPGRWGSSDPWLGIPVNWGQISGVRVVVETGMPHITVTPSEGSHFFHNMTAFRVGYLTVNQHLEQGEMDWAWLRSQTLKRSGTNGVHWIQLSDGQSVTTLIDGRSSRAVILKPGASHS